MHHAIVILNDEQSWTRIEGTTIVVLDDDQYNALLDAEIHISEIKPISTISLNGSKPSVTRSVPRVVTFREPSVPGWELQFNLNDKHFTLMYFGEVKNRWKFTGNDKSHMMDEIEYAAKRVLADPLDTSIQT